MKILSRSYLIFLAILHWFLISHVNAAFIDDKSRLNVTYINQIIKVPEKNYLEFLRSILKSAIQEKIPIAFRGTQHSQGGHTFYKNAWVLDFSSLHQMHMIHNKILRVQVGAKWKEVLNYLNDRKLSISVMQSDYDFSVGGTLSTNVHGWQANKQPLIHTVQGFHILLADGTYKYCNRQENGDLFKAAIGGYGSLGILIDVDLEVLENSFYQLQQFVIKVPDFEKTFLTYVIHNPKAGLFFGRFSSDSKNFLKNIIFNIYENEEKDPSSISLSSYNWLQSSVNYVFGLTYQSDFFKNVRWSLESNSLLRKFYTHMSRNTLLYHSVDNYVTNREDYIDLLQEFFIPLEKFNQFVSFLQSLQSEMIESLMNITVRHVLQDPESVLSYAQGDRIAFVMYFRGKKNSDFDKKLKALVLQMTDKALTLGGSYYLPYRAYQTREQFEKSYPNYALFQQIKLKYDPQEIFTNQFYNFYLKS